MQARVARVTEPTTCQGLQHFVTCGTPIGCGDGYSRSCRSARACSSSTAPVSRSRARARSAGPASTAARWARSPTAHFFVTPPHDLCTMQKLAEIDLKISQVVLERGSSRHPSQAVPNPRIPVIHRRCRSAAQLTGSQRRARPDGRTRRACTRSAIEARRLAQPSPLTPVSPHQSSVGRWMASTTSTSTAPRCASSFSPSCSCSAA
jgi:hypothetical protein